jgi:hypothetical protein
MALHKEDFDGQICHCGDDGCDMSIMYLHSSCHLGAPTEASYSGGEITIRCSVCKTFIASIAVASNATTN